MPASYTQKLSLTYHIVVVFWHILLTLGLSFKKEEEKPYHKQKTIQHEVQNQKVWHKNDSIASKMGIREKWKQKEKVPKVCIERKINKWFYRIMKMKKREINHW